MGSAWTHSAAGLRYQRRWFGVGGSGVEGSGGANRAARAAPVAAGGSMARKRRRVSLLMGFMVWVPREGLGFADIMLLESLAGCLAGARLGFVGVGC